MAPDIKATLARAAVIPRALAEEARALLDKNPQAFSPSLLYETATKKKIKDTERRLSEFRAITNDDELWDACERIVAAVSAEDSNYTYALVRNDATHLRYEEGGFFKTHQDFLSLMRSSGRSRPNASNCRSSRRPSARISATSPCTAT